MKNKFTFMIGLLIAAWLTMGCGVCSLVSKKGQEVVQTKVVEEVEKQLSATPGAKATATQSAKTQPTATQPAPTQPTATQPAKENEPPADDTLAALEQPTSYRYKLDLQTSQGDQVTRMTGQGAYVQDPPAYELDMETTEAGQTTTIHVIQVNDKVYVYDFQRDGWMVFDAQENDTSQIANPNELVKQEYLDAFKLEKKSETVNGQDCRVYKADTQDLPGATLGQDIQVTEGTVRLWISKKLNMLVRYQADLSGKKSDGSVVKANMQMDLTDINAAIQIEPPPEDKILEDMSGWGTDTESTPAASKGEAAKLPKPSDATPLEEKDRQAAQEMANSDDFDLYQTQMSVTEVAKFLEDAYSEAGWEKESWSTVSDEIALLFFTKGDQTAQVTATSMLVSGKVVVIVSVY